MVCRELLQLVDELKRDWNPYAAVILAQLNALETRGTPVSADAGKVRLIQGLYYRGLSDEQVRRLFPLIAYLTSDHGSQIK